MAQQSPPGPQAETERELINDDEGAHVGCQSGLRPRDTPLGLILFLVPTLLPIPPTIP